VIPDDARWRGLTAYSDAYTCYSAAVASWAAVARDDWRALVDTGLGISVLEAADGLFGFVHFPTELRAQLGLVRRSSGDARAAADAILEELATSGRVVVAGDGFALPWHVAHGKRHVPHWFVLAGVPEEPVVVDPFSARNELGLQEAVLAPIDPAELPQIARTELAGDAVVMLREAFALGDDARPVPTEPFQWFVHEQVDGVAPPAADAHGPDAIRRLARHFREHGGEVDAYRQAEDIWSIARHRAFLARYAAQTGDRDRAAEQLEPLARRWAHMAPLLMQAVLAVGAGRQPTGSVVTTLEDLADLEAAAVSS
jgi:hypothetical protein